jgi:hypothetical protein
MFLKRGETLSLVARRLGWVSASGAVQTSRLSRALGLMDDPTVGSGHRRRRIRYETAVQLCRALDLDPVDAGV